MTQVTFHPNSPVGDSQLRFAVICARYEGQWIFCRHKARITWEIPGGHREPGEPIEETARRELWEETGAEDFDITPIGVYNVSIDGTDSYGKLFFAEVRRLGELPCDMEIGELRFSQWLPEALTYPEIQPHLFKWTQGWLNIQSNAGEIWDVYDVNRNPTGRTHRRGDFLAKGDYHLVVHVWMRNSKGQFLLTKRSPNKGFPNMWETTGGSALAGDDSLTAALREVREETGLILKPENGTVALTYIGEDYITDVWLFHQDFALGDVRLLEGETCDVCCADKAQILRMKEDGVLVPYRYIDELMDRL